MLKRKVKLAERERNWPLEGRHWQSQFPAELENKKHGRQLANPLSDFLESLKEADLTGKKVEGSGVIKTFDAKIRYSYKVKTGLSKEDFKHKWG